MWKPFFDSVIHIRIDHDLELQFRHVTVILHTYIRKFIDFGVVTKSLIKIGSALSNYDPTIITSITSSRITLMYLYSNSISNGHKFKLHLTLYRQYAITAVLHLS